MTIYEEFAKERKVNPLDLEKLDSEITKLEKKLLLVTLVGTPALGIASAGIGGLVGKLFDHQGLGASIGLLGSQILIFPSMFKYLPLIYNSACKKYNISLETWEEFFEYKHEKSDSEETPIIL